MRGVRANIGFKATAATVAALIGATAMVSCVGLSPVEGASSAPTGNRQAISLYRRVAARTARMAGVQLTESGYTYVREQPATGAVDWKTALGARPRGYVRARDQVLVAFEHRRVAWVSDILHPEGCPQGGDRCGWSAFDLVLDASGLHGRLEGSGAACWREDTGIVAGFEAVGGPAGYRAFGRFAAPRRAGRHILITSSYPWTKDQRASEVDILSRRTLLPIRGVVHVQGARGVRGFTFDWTNRWTRKMLQKPRTVSC